MLSKLKSLRSTHGETPAKKCKQFPACAGAIQPIAGQTSSPTQK